MTTDKEKVLELVRKAECSTREIWNLTEFPAQLFINSNSRAKFGEFVWNL